MKFLTFLFLAAFAVAVSAFPEETKYDTKYDNFDIDSVLNNERLLKSYIKCLLEEGPCTPEAKDFRKILPEALSTSCSKCTDNQKTIIKKIIKKLYGRNTDWEKLMDKYDKDRQYQDSVKKFADL